MKNVILDTSVLLYDKNSIHHFEENNIYLPLVVLEEIDKKKSSPGVLGENARYINRFLDKLRSKGKLSEGCELGKGKLFVVKDYDRDVLDVSINQDNDTYIIAACKHLQRTTENVVLVSKDINLRVRADSFDIDANDYYKDHEDVQNFGGWQQVGVGKHIIDEIYSQGSIELPDVKLLENEFVLLKSSQNTSALAQYKDGRITLIPDKDDCKKHTGCSPKNKEQNFALSLMSDPLIPLCTLTGMPGSGKTYLAFMTGIHLISLGNFERIIYTRPIQTVDKGIGFLPGTMEEKWAPYLAPIEDNFQNAFGNLDYYHIMREKNQIDIAPISFIRGRSFKNAFIIVDEAQNATIHELKTIITRVGEGSKVVLCGDIAQIDNPYLTDLSNGLSIISNKFANSPLSGHIHFTKGYRSALASEADRILGDDNVKR